MLKRDNSFIIKQHWSRQIKSYLLGILLIPLAGIGLYILYRLNQSQKQAYFELSETQLIDQREDPPRKIDIENIESVNLIDDEFSLIFGTGSVLVKTPASELKLLFIPSPEEVKSTIEEAVKTRHEALKPPTGKTQVQNDFDPGSLDRMDYLTGLWKQGLINDEEYDKERKHFES